MTGNPFVLAADVIINTIFGIYILAVMLRFIFQAARVDFRNPLSQLIVNVTNPPLKPLRRVIPGWGGIDFSTIVLMVALTIIKLSLIGLITGQQLSISWLLFTTIADLISLLYYLLLGIIIISIIMSWIGQTSQNPMVGLLQQISEPILRPFRRIIPPIGGLDLSPIFAILALQIIKIFADWSLHSLATSL
ncbi:MAG: YggT family protein [Thiotrichales bacterium]|nr:YggT family protein [Thiotrichales bacterium]